MAPEAAPARRPWQALAPPAAALGLAVCMLALFCQTVLPGYSVLDYPADAFGQERAVQARAEGLAASIQPGGRVFFVHQGDTGYYWFRFAYHLLPLILDYSEGGGTFGPPTAEHTSMYYHPYTLNELRSYLDDKDCTYVLIDQLDDLFTQTYGPLFTDALRAAQTGPALYRRQPDGRYAPLATL